MCRVFARYGATPNGIRTYNLRIQWTIVTMNGRHAQSHRNENDPNSFHSFLGLYLNIKFTAKVPSLLTLETTEASSIAMNAFDCTICVFVCVCEMQYFIQHTSPARTHNTSVPLVSFHSTKMLPKIQIYSMHGVHGAAVA